MVVVAEWRCLTLSQLPERAGVSSSLRPTEPDPQQNIAMQTKVLRLETLGPLLCLETLLVKKK